MVCAQRPRSRFAAAILLAAGLIGGCGPGDAPGKAGASLPAREGWKPIDATKVVVPGTPVLAWEGPEGSELVFYRSIPIPGDYPDTAKALVTETSNRWTHLPGLEVKRSEVIRCGGHPAALVEAVAPGTGTALAPSGTGTPLLPGVAELIPTRRVLITLPLPGRTLSLQWHCPEAAADRIRPEIDAIAQSLRVEDIPAASQSY